MSAPLGRSRSGDRFYNPPAVRRQLQLQQQHQMLLQKQKREKVDKEREIENGIEKDNQKQKQQSSLPAPIHRSKRSSESENRTDSDDCASSTTATAVTPPPSTLPSTVAGGGAVSFSNSTNFDRFLEYTTPQVPGQHFPKTCIKKWRNGEDKFQPYFMLGDLWDAFKEWSAYGAGVPLLLNGSDTVVQYYVPYLSGIQLYVDPSTTNPRTRELGEDSDADSSRGSSDGSSDCEAERGPDVILQGGWSQQDLIEASRQGVKQLSIRDPPLNGSSSDEGECGSSPGVLTFEYFEHDPPYSREPLTDKILLLSSRFPGIRSYRSCDLSPASWISVAWYPIYRIPTGPTLQNLDSCFLTFHSLSTPHPGIKNECQYKFGSCPREVQNGFDMPLKLSLPIFGLAFYKFKTSVWDQTSGDECPKANVLLQAADEWLRLLNVNHPDYRFFASHSCYWR